MRRENLLFFLIIAMFLSAAETAQASGFLINNKSTLVLDCESTTGWTDFGTSGDSVFTVDATYYKTGSNSLHFGQNDSSGNFYVRRYKNIPTLDMSSGDNFGLWVYTPQVSGSTAYLQVTIANDSTFANSKAFYLGAGAPQGTMRVGWNLLQFQKADFSASTGTLDWSSVKTIMLGLRTLSSTAHFYVDSLYANLNARARLILTMDDADVSQIAAAQYATSRGLPISFFVISDTVETGGNLADWQALYAAGNDLMVHGVTALTTMSLEDARADVLHNKSYLDANFPRGSMHYGWPTGAFNAELQTLVTNLGFKTAGSLVAAAGMPTSYWYENHSLGSSDILAYNRTGMNGLSLASAKSYIDAAILRGTTLMFYDHTIGAASEWTTADWQALCDYVQAKVNARLIDVVTLPVWYTGKNVRSNYDGVVGNQ